MRRIERVLLGVLLAAVATLVIRDAGVQAAHARSSSDAGHAIATCAVPQIVNELMASDRYLPELRSFEEERREEIAELQSELQELEEEIRAAGPESPRLQARLEEARALATELRRQNLRLGRELDQRRAAQFAEVFTLVRNSAAAVADDLGYAYVISAPGRDEELSTTSVEQVLRQITARPLISSPDAVDITDDVRDDLNLD